MSAWAVTTAGASLEFDTTDNSYNACYALDSNHFINFWTGTTKHGQVQTFTVNTTTWAVTTAASLLEFDATSGQYNSCFIIDTNHFINFWSGTNDDGFAQVFTVNTSTFAVTTANASLEFDTQDNLHNSCFKIDANHFINFWSGFAVDGFVQVFAVNTSTWAVTTAGTVLEFDTQDNGYNSCYQVDANHFINFWKGVDSDGFVQVFAVNTSTWAVTTAGSALEFDTQNNQYNKCIQIDANHFINFWYGGSGEKGYCQIFAVNTSTWAVTTAGSTLEFETTQYANGYNSCYKIDDTHIINFWRGPASDGFVQVFAVNTSTWAVTTAATSLEFDTDKGENNACYKIDTNHFINFWRGTDNDGFVQVFAVELAAAGPANLKTLNTNTKSNIKTVNTNSLSNIKSLNTIT